MVQKAARGGSDMKKSGSKARPARMALAGLFVLAGLLWAGNFTIGVTELEVCAPDIPESFDGFRIALITDLHGRTFGKDQARLLSAVHAAKPDIIALAGDIADAQTDLQTLAPLFSRLTSIAPCFYVTGNHEWRMAGRAAFFKMLKDAGITWLSNTFVRLRRGEGTLLLVGMDDANGPADQTSPQRLMETLRREAGEGYTVVLHHRNDKLPLLASLGADLVLSGHSHGGVVRLPLLGGVFGAHGALFPDHTAGLYRQGKTIMAVSRGLGGGERAPMRIGNLPEVPLVILKHEEITAP